MEKMIKINNSYIVYIIFLVICFIASSCGSVLVTSISPNKTWQIKTTIYSSGIPDTYFIVELKNLITGEKKSIFQSPDESRDLTMRVIWAKDSTKFLIVGKGLYFIGKHAEYKNFQLFEDKKLRLKTGEGLYLLYDLKSNKVFCNCSDEKSAGSFDFDDLSKDEFQEKLLSDE
jgi:hypothetical protein